MKRIFLKISNTTLMSGFLLISPLLAAQVHSTTTSTAAQQSKPAEGSEVLRQSGMTPGMESNGPMAPQNNASFTYQHVSDGIRENMALETQLNELALKRSHNANIRNFAQQIIAENKDIDLQARSFAPNKTGKFPNGAFYGTRQQVNAAATQKKLRTLTGKKFDEVYLPQMAAYLRSDIEQGHEAYAMMEFPGISPVGRHLWDLSRTRMNELAKIAKEAGVHIATN